MSSLKISRTTWNLTPLFKNDDDPQIEKERKLITKKNYAFINKWKNRTDYLENPAILKEALDEYEVLARKYVGGGNEGYYFGLRSAQDENDTTLRAKERKAEEFANSIAVDIQFFTLSIAKIDPKIQKKFLGYKPLASYKHFLEKLFEESKYLLSQEVEKVLTLKSGPSHSNWTRMVSGFLSKEEREIETESGIREQKNFSQIMSLMESTDKKVRDSAAAACNNIFEKYVSVAENEINSILQNKKIDDELRGISRPDLTRHLSDDIDSQTVDTLVATVSAHFSIAHEFYKLKALLLGQKKLQYHERNIPYGQIDKPYTFAQATELIFNVFRNLDPQFSLILKKFIDTGSIDVYPKKGKHGGAFCAHYLITQPTYLLLNYTDKLSDVLTFAHELGHGINNELMRESQNALNFSTPLSTAEVASTFMEDFVLQELIKDATNELRLSIMMKKLNDDIGTIFRQVAAYRFEQELHSEFGKKGYVSKDAIGAIFQKHMKSYMGEYVEQSPGSQNWWVYWSHIRSFFYVYSYASGLLISKSLQNQVKKDPAFIGDVKQFLATGSSASPKEIFSKLHIDITQESFWVKGIQEIEELLKNTKALAKQLHKI